MPWLIGEYFVLPCQRDIHCGGDEGDLGVSEELAPAVFQVFDVVESFSDIPASGGELEAALLGCSTRSETRAWGAYGTEMRRSSGSPFSDFFWGRRKHRKKSAAARPPRKKQPIPVATPATTVGILFDGGSAVVVTKPEISQVVRVKY